MRNYKRRSKRSGGLEATVVEGGPGFLRAYYADYIALALAYRKYDVGKLQHQAKLARDGSVAFLDFVTQASDAYFEGRGWGIGPEGPIRPIEPLAGC
jgi:hypothetical protein